MNVLYSFDSKNTLDVANIKTHSVFNDDVFLSANPEKDEICEFLTVFKKDTSFIPNKYLSLKNTLSLTYDETFLSMPKETVKKSVENITQSLAETLSIFENEEYLLTFLCMKRFVRSLSRPSIDKVGLINTINSQKHEAVSNKLKHFLPDNEGLAEKTVYSFTGTTTGRLTVSSGPDILTTKSSVRKCFVSRFRGGKILQIDLSAAEPNIALRVAGKETLDDVYGTLSNEVFQGRITRKEAKLITLCALYGQSPKNLKEKLPEDISPGLVIQKTKDYLDVNNLYSVLRKRLLSKNLRNILGRPIYLDTTDQRLLLSYYLQSSAAELSILLFSEWAKNNERDSMPLYVVHDALIVDCSKSLSEKLLSKKEIVLSLGDWSFVAKVSDCAYN